MKMHGFHPLIGRRHFLATTVLGTVGALLPAGAAHASMAPPPGAATLTPTPPAPATAPSAAIGDASLIAASSAAAQAGDTSIRPFKYRAGDAELADLKRRIKETKWPDRETVNDDSQGVRLATIQKVASYWTNHH